MLTSNLYRCRVYQFLSSFLSLLLCYNPFLHYEEEYFRDYV